MSLRPAWLGALLAAAMVLAAAGPPSPAAARVAPPATCPAVGGQASVPSPAETLGRPLSSAAPSPDDTVRVLQAIARASPRVTVGDSGRSDQGRPLTYAIVGSPATLQPDRLAAIAARARAVRAGGVGPVAVERAARGPAIVWLGGGVHANEPSGTTALLETVHRLATDDSCATRRVLRDVVTVVVPDQNPDGHVDGSRNDASGFDLNRDWFAAARPETRARLALLRRLPPTVAIDFHEQTGRDYFTPPYEQPVVAGAPAASRRFADRTVAPAVGRELRRRGAHVVTGDGYDLLYPGYADSATSLLLGSGGMTFEQGSDPPLATKTTRHATAARVVLETVARHRATAIRAWASGFRRALDAGARGRTVTGCPVTAWVLRTETRAADARRLARRLQEVGVVVSVLTRPVTVRRYRAAGSARAAAERLPAGTLVVPSRQALQRWPDVLLGREIDPCDPGHPRVDSWSLPQLDAVVAGIAGSAIPASATRPFSGEPAAAVRSSGRLAIDGDSAAAAQVVLGLLADGVAVERRGDGDFALPATAEVAGALQRALLTARDDGGAPGEPLRSPSVVVIADDAPGQLGPPALLPGTGGDRPSGWIPAVLRGARVPTSEQTAAHLALGVRPGTTHLVLGPGTVDPAQRSAALAASLGRFIADGGRLIVVGREGRAAATALGLSRVRGSTVGGTVSGAAVTVAATPAGTPTGRALGGPTRVVWHGDERLSLPAGATALLQTASTTRLGPPASPLATLEPQGGGDVVTLGFSPVFRDQSAGGRRVLLGLLLG